MQQRNICSELCDVDEMVGNIVFGNVLYLVENLKYFRVNFSIYNLTLWNRINQNIWKLRVL